jgi:hypothetical protein
MAHQVALSADFVKLMYLAIDEVGRELGMAPRHHSVVINDRWHLVYCFANPLHQRRFRVVPKPDDPPRTRPFALCESRIGFGTRVGSEPDVLWGKK